MARRWYGRDRGLTTRITLTLFGLGLLYVIFIAALIAAGVGAVMVLVIAAVFAAVQLLFGDKLALRSMGARVTEPAEAPELHEMIERLCQLADLPKPKVAVAETELPERVRRGAQPQERDGLRHHRPDAAPDPRPARGRHRPRAVAHRQPGRRRDDRRGIPRDGRRPARAHRRLQRRWAAAGRRTGRRSSWSSCSSRCSSTCSRSCCCAPCRATASSRPTAAPPSSPARRPSSRRRSPRSAARSTACPTRDLRAAEGMNAFFIIPAVAKGFSLSSLVSTHPPVEKRIERLMAMQATLDATPAVAALEALRRGPARRPARAAHAQPRRPRRPVRDRVGRPDAGGRAWAS